MGWVGKILGVSMFDVVRITTPSQNALLSDLENHFTAGRGFAVATVNLDHIVKLRRDAEFREAYARHSHVVADGNPIVWLHRIAGRPVELVPGSDLVAPLAALAARRNIPVALLGATRETLDIAAERLAADHEGLEIVAKLAPSRDFDPAGEEAEACLAKVADSGARICLLALGAPKQERLAMRGIERLPDCGFVSIGAGLDFIAGTQQRAPLWLRQLAMEWFWRLTRDRKRLAKRYLDCAAILPSLAAGAAWHRVSATKNARSRVEI